MEMIDERGVGHDQREQAVAERERSMCVRVCYLHGESPPFVVDRMGYAQIDFDCMKFV